MSDNSIPQPWRDPKLPKVTLGGAGRAGATESAERTGAYGAAGTTGATEATGNTEATGRAAQQAQGSQGAQQAQGTQGAQQAQQAQGTQGAQQAQGTQGTQGAQQAQQAQGSQGAQQAQGSQGAQGAQQAQGTQGAQLPSPSREALQPKPFLPKKGNYRDLLVYKKAECLYDITYYFAHHYFVERKDRTIDQVIQAARSGKQNIAEGCSAATTSSETEIKLIGVARASMQEVLVDYEDYLRTRGLQQWSADDPRTHQTKAFCREHYSPADYTKGIEQRSPEALCNIAITLIHQYDKLMEKLLDSLQRNFVEQGGIRERMTAARLGYRNEQKARIAELENENAKLRARVAELEALLSQKGGER